MSKLHLHNGSSYDLLAYGIGYLCTIEQIGPCSIQLFHTVIALCRGIDLSRWKELREEGGEVANLEKFAQHVHGNHFIPNTAIVDCTADPGIAGHYYDWLRKGIHVITPNKKANSGPLDQVK
jgi:homoserine dehydrogenase